jgi:predicted MFS family arabinose efflux permease
VRDRATAATFLLGVCGTWNAGNIGPVTGALADEFSASLTEIGLYTGACFFAGVVAAGLAGAELSQRISIPRGLRIACLLFLGGNVLIVVTPEIGGLVAGRVAAGLGSGLIFLFGGGFARNMGGVRLLGVFGSGITLGIAGALGIGGLLEEIGVDWRWAFALTAALALVPMPLIPGEVPAAGTAAESREGLFRDAFSRLAFWRISLLGVATLGVPFVIGAWLIAYLTGDDAFGSGLAGLVSFGLFALTAVMRYVGGRLSAGGTPPGILAAGSCLIAAAGIAVLAIDNEAMPALVAVALMGLGMSLPAALAYDEAERVLPGKPLGGLGLMQAIANAFPIAALPLVGVALDDGNAEAGFLGLAAFVLLAGLANLRPPVAAQSG